MHLLFVSKWVLSLDIKASASGMGLEDSWAGRGRWCWHIRAEGDPSLLAPTRHLESAGAHHPEMAVSVRRGGQASQASRIELGCGNHCRDSVRPGVRREDRPAPDRGAGQRKDAWLGQEHFNLVGPQNRRSGEPDGLPCGLASSALVGQRNSGVASVVGLLSHGADFKNRNTLARHNSTLSPVTLEIKATLHDGPAEKVVNATYPV